MDQENSWGQHLTTHLLTQAWAPRPAAVNLQQAMPAHAQSSQSLPGCQTALHGG